MRRLGATIGIALVLIAVLPGEASAATIEQTYAVGARPWGTALDPTSGRLYVANSQADTWGDNYISVVDPAAGTTSRIDTPAAAAFVAIDPSLRRLYATQDGNALLVIDLDTQSIVTRIPGIALLGLAVDAGAHRVYASALSTVTVIDGTTNAVVSQTTAPNGGFLRSVALDVTAHRVYVLNYDSRSVEIFDDRDLTFIDRVVLPDQTWSGLAVDEARQLVFVTGFDPENPGGPGRLHVIDAMNVTLVSTVTLSGGFPMGITHVPSAHRLYVTNNATNDVSVLDDQTLASVAEFMLPWSPAYSLMHPDGRLYVTGEDSFYSGVLGALNVTENSAPTVTLSLSDATPRSDEVLVATATAQDADGGPLTLVYTWSVDGVAKQVGASNIFDLAVAGNGDRGQTVLVEVVASDGALESAVASASALVVNSSPTVTVSLNDTSPQSRDLVVATANVQDADSDPLTVTYVWSVNGDVKQTGANNTFDLAVKGQGDNGDVVTVLATASDGIASASATASATVTPGRRK